MDQSYYSPAPPKRSNCLVIGIVVALGLVILCCGGSLFFGLNIFGKSKNTIGCLVEFTQLQKALTAYANANQGKLPDGAKWQQELAPYYSTNDKSDNKLGIDVGDPSQVMGCKGQNGEPNTGIAFNDALAKMKLSSVTPDTVLFFEVPTAAMNQHSVYKPQAGFAPQKMVGQQRDWLYITLDGTTSKNGKTVRLGGN